MPGNPHPLAKKVLLYAFCSLIAILLFSVILQLSLVDDGIDILSKSIEGCFSTVKDWKIEVLVFLVAEFFICAWVESKWFGGPPMTEVIRHHIRSVLKPVVMVPLAFLIMIFLLHLLCSS